MNDIRVLTEEHYDEFARIQAYAYPGMLARSAQEIERLRDDYFSRLDDHRVTFYGSFLDNRLVAGMRLHDYIMNLRGAVVPVGGVGAIAVDLPHKREHVCGDMVRFYLDLYKSKGAPMAVLWPFRPDFYRRMGFGYGGKKYRYSVAADALPFGPSRAHLRYLTVADLPAITEYYNHVFTRTNGLLDEIERTWRVQMDHSHHRFIGYERDGQLRGFFTFRFDTTTPGSWLTHNLHVLDCFYDDADVLAEFCTFLNSQHDQVGRIVFDTPDPDFHHLVLDPRNGTDNLIPPVHHECAVCAIGTMYRIIDLTGVFAMLGEAAFGDVSMCLRIIAEDRFYTGDDQTVTLQIDRGRPTVIKSDTCDAEIRLDIADLSSLLVGSISMARLFEYGRVAVSDSAQVDTVDRFFFTRQTPYCRTSF